MSQAFHFGQFVKQAINVERAGLPSRALASTVGHVGGALSGLPILTLKSHVNPTDVEGATGGWNEAEISDEDTRAMKLKQLAQDMEKANPQALGNHNVVLGGTRLTRDIPRIVMNPRTSILGKGLGLATYPITALMMNSMRGSHYNPFSDTTHLYGNSPATLTHELGHALDFNERPVPKGTGLTGWLRRQGGGLMRDGYMLSRGLTPLMLYQEAAANIKSEDALRKVYKNDPKKLNQILDERQKVLPAGMGSYLGSVAGPMGPLAGLAAGKLYGLSQSAAHGGKYVHEGKSKAKPKAKREDDADESSDEEQETPRRKAAGFHPETYRIGRFLFKNEPWSQGNRVPLPGLGYTGSAGIGGALGSLIGAYNAEKGQKLKGALRGGLVGVGTGLGARAAGGLAMSGLDNSMINPQYAALAAALGGGFVGSAAGAGIADGVEGKEPENPFASPADNNPKKKTRKSS